jgi:GNAT superfamily N-acetyltransferase
LSRTVFAVEPYHNFIIEGRKFYPEHWAELAVYKDIPLSVDDEFYDKMAAAGVLIVYTARRFSELIGYSLFIARRGHPHYSKHSWAVNDIVWVKPEYRDGSIGMDFIDFWDEHLKSLGVCVVHVGVKVAHPALAFALRKRGYVQVDKGYEKRLN